MQAWCCHLFLPKLLPLSPGLAELQDEFEDPLDDEGEEEGQPGDVDVPLGSGQGNHLAGLGTWARKYLTSSCCLVMVSTTTSLGSRSDHVLVPRDHQTDTWSS